jgi:hypothetical protein
MSTARSHRVAILAATSLLQPINARSYAGGAEAVVDIHDGHI